MSKIKLEDIQDILTSDNWKILSNEYTNLDTEMKFQCSEGHEVFATWNKIRKNRFCPVCAQNVYKEQKDIIIPKQKGINRILALDQATHTTGWSIYDGKSLVRYGTFDTHSEDEIERYSEVRNWLLSMIENWQPDLIGIEGIQYQANFGVTTFQTLARLQGILMMTCYENKIRYEVCPTNTWRAHCNVKGRTRSDRKKSMQLLVKEWFDITVKDDISDAIGIGKYLADYNAKKTELIDWTKKSV